MIDSVFKISYYYSKEGQAYFNKLHDFKESESSSNVYFHDVSWDRLIQDSITFDKNNLYYIITNDTYENNYDFLNELGIKCMNNVYLKYNAKSLSEVFDAKCPMNVFGVDLNQKTILDEDTYVNDEDIKWIVENGISIIKSFIKAGFLEKERFVQEAVPCWTLNVESHFTKAVILEYELFPPKNIIFSEKICVGKLTQEKFRESADYRYEISDIICRVLANIGLHFNLISEVTLHQKVNFDLILENIG